MDTVERMWKDEPLHVQASTERLLEHAMEFEAQRWESAARAGSEDSWNVSDEGDCTKRKESRRRLAETDARETAACRVSHEQGEKKLLTKDGGSILPTSFLVVVDRFDASRNHFATIFGAVFGNSSSRRTHHWQRTWPHRHPHVAKCGFEPLQANGTWNCGANKPNKRVGGS